MSVFKKKCLLIDDDPIVLDFFNLFLGDRTDFIYLNNGSAALSTLHRYSFDIVFVDLGLPDVAGHQILKEIRECAPDLPVVVISSSENIQDAILSFRRGAMDFLTKPLDEALLLRIFKKCIQHKELVQRDQIIKDHLKGNPENDFIGRDLKILALEEDLRRLRGSEIDTLIIAETGCGKELVARKLNQQEAKPARPFVTLNCSAIPRELIESILFGHEKGSFTGADRKQIGKFELANNGDIFLDEIGTLPLDLQAKLLRVLQEREIEPVGAGVTKKLNFRVIAATNEDLQKLVSNGTFRKDLYFRLNKMTLKIPPLRERLNDLDLLVDHFLRKKSRRGLVKTISKPALNILRSYDWPGNVRELENVIENLIFTSKSNEIVPMDLERLELVVPKTMVQEPPAVPMASEEGNLDLCLKRYERTLIVVALKKFKKKQDVATYLGLDRKTLFRKVKIHGLE